MVVPVASIINIRDKNNFIPSDNHPSAVANQAIAIWMAKSIKLEN
jgi:hypothetical protein